MFKFPSFNERTGELGMQPKLHYPRRSRFAPKCKLRSQLKADSSKLKDEVGYIKERVCPKVKRYQHVCQDNNFMVT